MASITRAQLNKYNEACKNGFMFDLQYFLTHGEKQVIRIVKQADGSQLHAVIWFMPEYEQRKNAYGQTFQVPTGRHQPEVHISRYVESRINSNMLVSHGMGKSVVLNDLELGKPCARRTFSTLQKLTAAINDAWIETQWAEAPARSYGGVIVG